MVELTKRGLITNQSLENLGVSMPGHRDRIICLLEKRVFTNIEIFKKFPS